MKPYHQTCMTALLLLTAFLLAMHGLRRNEEALAARIAPEVLRFHVIANSDSSEDQALKFAVKDFLLETIREDLPSSTALTKDMVKQYILDNKSKLEETAVSYIEEKGFSYPAKICLETCAFPRKTYGDVTFPAGNYEAVRVLIGAGGGENFWCVLYPSLCYLDHTYAVMPDESKKQLRALVSDDDFSALLRTKPAFYESLADRIFSTGSGTKKAEQKITLPRISIHFRLLDLFASD